MKNDSAALTGLLLLVSGCTHQYQLTPFNAAQAPLQRSQAKHVAVVLAPGIQDVYETSTDGHSFVFENGLAFYERLFGAALGGSVASVRVFRGQPTAGFHAYVYPELSLESSGMVTHTCTARFAVSIKDGSGRVMARNQKTSEDTFVPIEDAGRACNTAITAAFNATTYATLAALDSW